MRLWQGLTLIRSKLKTTCPAAASMENLDTQVPGGIVATNAEQFSFQSTYGEF